MVTVKEEYRAVIGNDTNNHDEDDDDVTLCQKHDAHLKAVRLMISHGHDFIKGCSCKAMSKITSTGHLFPSLHLPVHTHHSPAQTGTAGHMSGLLPHRMTLVWRRFT